MIRTMVLLILSVTALVACDHDEDADGLQPMQDLTLYVDPFIGTDGSGNSVPGPCLPHSMVKLSPDTNAELMSVEGYEYEHDKIQGFSHTHIQGPGGSGNGYSQILLIPTVGAIETTEKEYASSFSHESEAAGPGYYRVRLDDYGIIAELTATDHCGFHQYTFPDSQQSHILIDPDHTRGIGLDGQLEIVGDCAVSGYGVYTMHPLLTVATWPDPGTTAKCTVYFYAEFSRSFDGYGTWKRRRVRHGSNHASGREIGAFLNYATSADEVIQVRVGISSIDVEQARENLAREIPSWDFTRIRGEARQQWNEVLNRIVVEGGTQEQRVAFYTALYHSLLHPTDYTEYGRHWSGADGSGEVFASEGRRFYSDDWCVWDTFRTTHPLQTLVEPQRRSDIIQSYVHLYEQGGWLPKCTWQATGYSRIMIGNHTTCVILDAYRKGFRDFDVDKAYEAMKKSAMEDNPNILSKFLCGYLNLGTPPDYLDLGYVPHECDSDQSVSMSLEYAYNDWCLARMADALGHFDDRETFLQRAMNYVNHWNPDVAFMQARSKYGQWIEPFDPTDETGFCEADAWKYTWFVPHDQQGLINLMGGPRSYTEMLDAFFEGGHYEASNEPDFHVPYLYVYGGAPHKTQKKVRELLDSEFSADPSGLPGNNDSGATSSWYVLSAMGLYPVCPGDMTYIIGSPLFDRVVLDLDPRYHQGDRFVIEAQDNSEANVYVQEAFLNGESLPRAWLHHSEVVGGGTLVLKMGPEPSDWACEPDNAPPSLSLKAP